MKPRQILDFVVTFLLVSLAFEVLTPQGFLLRPIRPWLEAQGIPIWLFSLVAFILALAMLLGYMKAGILNLVPESIGVRAAQLHEFPNLDGDTLQRYTHVFQNLGFVWVTDYTLTQENSMGGNGFGRLFIHPQHHCYAEINQTFMNGRAANPVGFMIASGMEGGYQLSTTNRKPDGGTWILRRPKSLWTSHPTAAPAALLQTHLERRQALSRELGVGIRTDASWDAYYAQEQIDTRARREVVKKKPMIVILAEMILFTLSPKLEWMGSHKIGPQAAEAPRTA